MPTLYDVEGNPVEVPDNPGDLRNLLEAANKRAAEAEAARQAAEVKAGELLEPAVRSALSDLPPGAVKTWMLAHPGELPSDEAKTTFATEYGYSPTPPVEPEVEQKQEQEAPAITMTPTEDGITPGPKVYTPDELTDLWRTNRVAANKAVADGRVSWGPNDQSIQESIKHLVKR